MAMREVVQIRDRSKFHRHRNPPLPPAAGGLQNGQRFDLPPFPTATRALPDSKSPKSGFAKYPAASRASGKEV
ncbi:hypothetical protein B9Z55_028161 [Caenorhabditis nigoni]|uniref:Uncharacterized protein n=2 Tax=Caenorhabditis nigoni TaxID=1611254 RepID=A0A2G5SD16_9PELO|nr:hypothetical protein B9Z55_028161 [Caenorhabditis nigoni]